jgi:hypothetical protein
VQRVARHDPLIRIEQAAGAVQDGGGDGDDGGEQLPGEVEHAAPVLPPSDGPVALQDLLEHLGVNGRFDLTGGHPLEQRYARPFVRMVVT